MQVHQSSQRNAVCLLIVEDNYHCSDFPDVHCDRKPTCVQAHLFSDAGQGHKGAAAALCATIVLPASVLQQQLPPLCRSASVHSRTQSTQEGRNTGMLTACLRSSDAYSRNMHQGKDRHFLVLRVCQFPCGVTLDSIAPPLRLPGGRSAHHLWY